MNSIAIKVIPPNGIERKYGNSAPVRFTGKLSKG
jgi:hypothetical protein